MTVHHYLSTACLHGDGAYCRSHTGQCGLKTPAQCRFCSMPCVCSCRTEPDSPCSAPPGPLLLDDDGEPARPPARPAPLFRTEEGYEVSVPAEEGIRPRRRRERVMFAPTLADLDRCAHGRHAADPCCACPGGHSTGNLFLAPGQRIGTTVHGDPITAPIRAERGAD